jgi:hypothetical protein
MRSYHHRSALRPAPLSEIDLLAEQEISFVEETDRF